MSASSAITEPTWKMIGTNEDADNYLLNGGKTGCGSVASAAQHRGTKVGRQRPRPFQASSCFFRHVPPPR